MNKLKETLLLRKLKGITLSNGQSAVDYLKDVPEQHKKVVIESILEVYRKGWPLNDLEISSEARERNRKRLGIK